MTDDPKPEAILAEAGRRHRLSTGDNHLLQLPADWMSVCFLIDTASGFDAEYPKYRLRSTDGAYEKTLGPKDDLIPGDAYLELRFEKLLPGRRYTLTRLDDAERERDVFADVPFIEVVDQPRAMHEELEAHAYGDFAMTAIEGKAFADWLPEDDGKAA